MKGVPLYVPLRVPQLHSPVPVAHLAYACTEIVEPEFVIISLVMPVVAVSVLFQVPLNCAAGKMVAVAVAGALAVTALAVAVALLFAATAVLVALAFVFAVEEPRDTR